MSQQAEIARVSGRIAPAIVAFCRSKVGCVFYAFELQRYVEQKTDAAPASADRILRDLRQRGVIRYKVVDRSLSMYLCEGVAR